MPSKKKSPAPAKPAPLIIRGAVPGTVSPIAISEILMATHSSRELADMLRNRGLKIPNAKRVMADRLALWAWATHDRFTLTIGS